MKIRFAVGISIVAFCLVGLFVTGASAATKSVSALGGSVRFAGTVSKANSCSWTSSPKIEGFEATVECRTGIVARSAVFMPNTSSTTKTYTISLTVHGVSTTVERWLVKQAGEVTTKTTLTVSELKLGESTDAEDWKAVVKATGGPSPTPRTGQIIFTLSSGGVVLATFTGSPSNPAECTFSDSITGTGETITSVSPDQCSGGVAGIVQVTLAQLNAPDYGVQANYAGGEGWSSSSSGVVNSGTVAFGSSSSA
jgi:hypothetical protein